jgi:hypothetical protein
MITGVDLISDSLAIMLDGSGGGTPAVMDEKTITDNGVYYPRDETPPLDGYNKVTVNVIADEQVLLYIYYLKYGKWYDPDDPVHDPESPEYDPDDKLPETPVEVIEYIDDLTDEKIEEGYEIPPKDLIIPPKDKFVTPAGTIYNVEVRPTDYKWVTPTGQKHPNFDNFYNVNAPRLELEGFPYLQPIVEVIVNGVSGYFNMNVGGHSGSNMNIYGVSMNIHDYNLVTIECDWAYYNGGWNRSTARYTLMINE